MKHLLSIATVLAVLLVGCSKDTDITSPINDQVSVEYLTYTSEEGFGVEATYTISQMIDGEKGGFIFYGDLSKTQSGNKGNVYAACVFPSGAFSGKTKITMTLDTKQCTGTFEPSMVFDKPVSFSAMFTGVNFKGVDISKIRFVYYDINDVKYEISSSYLHIDVKNKVLGIINAELPHFSRYGFLR